MNIRISKESEVPIRHQLAEQIVVLIASGKLRPAEALPSVRELARRLKIHHNTVSEAYQDLVKRNWLVRKRGSHLVVRSVQAAQRVRVDQELDELINATVEMARQRGYSLQALRKRVRERLLAQPADHILVVEQEQGLRRLQQEEIRSVINCPVEGCSREDLTQNPGLAIGALVVTPQYAIGDVTALVPKDRPLIPLTFSSFDEYTERVQKLKTPSVIAVVSISRTFLSTAESLIAPAMGRRHSFVGHLLPLENRDALRAADLVFCDTIAFRSAGTKNCIHCSLLSPASLEYVSSAFASERLGLE